MGARGCARFDTNDANGEADMKFDIGTADVTGQSTLLFRLEPN